MINKFIVIEGLDGAGKSEVSKKVASALGITHLESPIDPFKEIRTEIDENLCSKGRFYFYLSSNYKLSDFVKKNKNLKSIICARYFYSTIIGYFSKLNIKINSLYENPFILENEFLKPDLVIFLHVNKEEQSRRINSRDESLNSASDFMCLENDEYQELLSLNYKNISKNENWIKIDTSEISEQEVVEKCLKEIRNL
jgi:thymidylate kinase